MVDRTILGTQIRERRRQLGVTQAELARQIGISASYMNLIERNKRRIAGPLLRRTADALGLRQEDLDGAADRRLAEGLTEVAHMPALSALGLESEGVGELIGRFPAWARALAALARSEREAHQTARALSDRLTHDPFLGEIVHRVLSRVAAIRSAAEILTEFDDVDAEQRTRFHRIIAQEAQVLTDVGEALAAYFEEDDTSERVLTPIDEVESYFEACGNHVALLEDAATRLVDFAGRSANIAEAEVLAAQRLRPVITELVAQAPQIETAAASARAEAALLEYAALALILPMGPFKGTAKELQYDIEAIAALSGVDHQTICRRLASLPEEDGIPQFGYIRANASGTIIQLLGLEGLVLPRYAAACPLWALYRAQQAPGEIVHQRAVFPNGARFVFVAFANRTGPQGFGQPRHYVTDMIAMTEADAVHTVYGPAPAMLAEPVGSSCRLCPRNGCMHRVRDPLAG